jgi:hypothetical protein
MLFFKSGGNLNDRGVRPSPKESATLFSLGHTQKGQDGNLWKVVIASNGVKRWNKVPTTSAKSAKTIKTKKTPLKKAKPIKSKPIQAKKKATKSSAVSSKKAKRKK